MTTLPSGFQMPVIGLGTSVSYLSRSCQFLLLIFFSFSTDPLPPDQAEVEKLSKLPLKLDTVILTVLPCIKMKQLLVEVSKHLAFLEEKSSVRIPEASDCFYSK
jgi:hypothetical protein